MTVAETEERAPSRRKPVRTALAVVGYAVPLLVVLAVTKPRLFGFDGTVGFLHLVSFPLVLGCCWFGFALVLGAFAVFLRHRFAVWLVVVAVFAGVLNVATVARRGFADGLPTPAAGTVTVVTLNTLGGAASPSDVAAFVAHVGADAVALPETPAPLAREIAAASARRGRPMQVLGGAQSPAAVAATSLLVARSMGTYRVEEQPDTGLGAVVAGPARGRGPTIAAVHSPPPLTSSSPWRTGADQAVDLCRDGRAAVVLGDVNATVDHAPLADLGRCVDAGTEVGAGAEGTWPAQFPAAFAAPIDHVLVDAGAWRPVDTAAARVGGSDHRALVAQLRAV